MTANTNPATVKWANWMGANGIGIIQHCCGGKSASWYKPHASCKMNLLGSPFCSVCAQTVIEAIHGKVNPVVSYTPAGPIANTPGQFATFKLSKVMKPKPNSLRIIWTLDGNIVAENVDSFVLDQNTLADGTHFLNANVIDTTFLLRVNNHVNIHNSLVHWSINKNNVGINANSNSSKISCSVYPNPTSQTLHISLELERNSPVRIHILSNDGKMIQEVLNHSLQAGMHERSINIEQFARGKYNLVYKVGESLHTEPFIVE
ncbi:MAG: T9SS type A sorting domain-containing protein [Bacteroidetes bacterium]|nr:T9SS type A sorting domain-containing protein [Bacteroidota bacterium]